MEELLRLLAEPHAALQHKVGTSYKEIGRGRERG